MINRIVILVLLATFTIIHCVYVKDVYIRAVLNVVHLLAGFFAPGS